MGEQVPEPWTAGLSDLKRRLKNETMEAITDAEMRRKYTFGVGVESDWKSGSRYQASTRSATTSPGMAISEGENLEVDPPRRLVQSFVALWSDDVRSEGTSRVTWETLTTPGSLRYLRASQPDA